MYRVFFLALGLGLASCSSDPAATPVAPAEYVPLSSPEMSWLVGEWTSNTSGETKRLVVQDNPKSLIYERHKSQVGSKSDPTLPYPTICSYRYYSTQFGVKRGGSSAQSQADYSLVTRMNRIELLSDAGTSDQCSAFASAETQNITNMPYVMDFSKTIASEMSLGNWIFHKIEPSP